MNFLFDTNVILDLIDTTRKSSKASLLLYEQVEEKKDIDIIISADSITTIIHVLRRSGEDALGIVSGLLETFKVVGIDTEIIKSSISNSRKFKIDDYEDAQILTAALSDPDCAAIITNDAGFLEVNADIEIVSVSKALKALGWEFNEILQEWVTPDPNQNIIFEQSKKRDTDD